MANERVLLIYGNQEWLIRREAVKFEHQVLGDSPTDFAQRRFDMGDLKTRGTTEGSIEEWEVTLKTKPFLCDQYLVRLDSIQQLKLSGIGSEVGRNVWEMLKAVLENLPDGLHILMTALVAREGDLSKPLLPTIRAMRGLGRAINHITYEEWNGASWVVNRAKAKGLQLDNSQADLMISLAGRNMERLENELEKLALISKKRVIDDLLITISVGGVKEAALFAVAGTLANRDLPSMLSELNALLGNETTQSLPLVMVLVRFFRQARMLQDSNHMSANERAKMLGLHPMLARRLEKQVQNFQKNEVEHALALLYKLEHQVKQVPSLGFVLLRKFCQQICQGDLKSS